MFMHRSQGNSSYFWAAFPFLSCLFCILLTMVPFGLSNAYMAPPSFTLVAVFIWILIRPSLMPLAGVGLLGLLQDLVWGGPVGLWGAVFLVAYVLTVSQRQFLSGRGFGFTWAAFGVVIVSCEILAWLIASVFYWTAMPILPILSQTILSFAIYPVFARLSPFFIRRIGEPNY
jgi:rod shape-determining protein MreD